MHLYNTFKSHLTTRLVVSIALLLSVSSAYGTSNETIDKYVQEVMATFHVPGVAVGVVKDGAIIHMKGYGIADIESGENVDEFTIFKIASNTKAFTATALATLVEQGKMEWTDKVNQHLPDFKMYDQYASQEFNIIDLLTHRSGLGLGSGDLMLWPEPTKFTREQLVKNLRYLKPAYGFREKYAHDNTLYIVAGEVAASIAGTTWEEYIEQSIFKPLGMENCYAGGVDTNKVKNVVATHLYMNGQSIVDQPNRIRKNSTLMAAAGGIKCSLHDLMTWVDLQLRHGVTKDGTRLVSEEQALKMWYPVTPLRVSKSARELDNTNFRGYALGWRVNDYRGQWMVGHTGTLSGAMSQIVLLPDSNLAVVVLLNQSSGYARNALSRGITNYFLGEDPKLSLLRNV
ncbi:MAG: beta-lactamase family protein, partial [Gammaproteobacteria bacterium]|nr:beta-lactamase family protein [Gammaproteobacteria bacterium]NNJ71899.1 beta-lactamase family protein [Enterobacterales bacterium]